MKWLLLESLIDERFWARNILFISIIKGRKLVEKKDLEILMAKFPVNLYQVTHVGWEFILCMDDYIVSISTMCKDFPNNLSLW